MKKYLLGSLAIVFAISFSAFTKPTAHLKKEAKFTTGIYWYVYSGPQTTAGRQIATNYTTPTLTAPSCSGNTIECAVEATVTLDPITGLPPANPNFTGASFDTNGFPIVSGPVDGNDKKN